MESLHEVELNLRLVVAEAAHGVVVLMNVGTVRSRSSAWPLGNTPVLMLAA